MNEDKNKKKLLKKKKRKMQEIKELVKSFNVPDIHYDRLCEQIAEDGLETC